MYYVFRSQLCHEESSRSGEFLVNHCGPTGIRAIYLQLMYHCERLSVLRQARPYLVLCRSALARVAVLPDLCQPRCLPHPSCTPLRRFPLTACLLLLSQQHSIDILLVLVVVAYNEPEQGSSYT